MTDRLPPHSSESEQGVLGCILLDPVTALPTCIERLRSGAVVFYDIRNQTLYETLVELYEDQVPIDLISLQERLKTWGKLRDSGGMEYIATLPDKVPSAVNIDYYLEVVQDKYTIRRMIQTCIAVVQRMYEGQGDTDEMMDQVEREVLQISESRVMPKNLNIQTLVREAIDEIEAATNHNGTPQGLTTGFHDFDKMTDGLHPGEMVVLAARPGMGKSSWSMNVADHVACNSALPVGVISLEMTAKELVKRMICSRARVNARNLYNGFCQRDFPKLAVAAGKLHRAPLYIDDTAGQSILQIRAKARRWWQQYQIKLLIVDYLQLANAEGGKRRFENRQVEVSQISVGIKNLAKELAIPIIALCQLNRDIERDRARKPRLSDLRESGSLEADADLVGMLYKAKTDNDDDEESECEAINLLIAKSRNGPTGDVNLTFLKQFTRFESAAKVSDQDVPQQRELKPTTNDP